MEERVYQDKQLQEKQPQQMEMQENNDDGNGVGNDNFLGGLGNIFNVHVKDEVEKNKIKLAECYQKITILQEQVEAGEIAIPEKHLHEFDKILWDMYYGKTIIDAKDSNYLKYASNITQSLLPKIFSFGEAGNVIKNTKNIIQKAGVSNQVVAAVKNHAFKGATNWIFGIGMSAMAAFSKSSLGVKALLGGGVLASILGITFRKEIANTGKIGYYKTKMALTRVNNNKDTKEDNKNGVNNKLIQLLEENIKYNTEGIDNFAKLQEFIIYVDENVKILSMANNPLLYVNKDFKKNYLQFENDNHDNIEIAKRQSYDEYLGHYIDLIFDQSIDEVSRRKDIFKYLLSIIQQKKVYEILLKDITCSDSKKTVENYELFFMLEKSIYDNIVKIKENIKYLGFGIKNKVFTFENIFQKDCINLFNKNKKTVLNEIKELEKNQIHQSQLLLSQTDPTPQKQNNLINDNPLQGNNINLNKKEEVNNQLNMNEKVEQVNGVLNCLESIKPFDEVNNSNKILLRKAPINFLNNNNGDYLFPLGLVNKLESVVNKIEYVKISKEDFSPIKNFFSEMFIFFIPREFKKIFFKVENLYFSNNFLINNIKSCGKSYGTFLLGKQFCGGELKNTLNTFFTHYKKPLLKVCGVVLFFPIFYYLYQKINQDRVNKKFNQPIGEDQNELDSRLTEIFYTDNTFSLPIMKNNIIRIVEYVLVDISIEAEKDINNNLKKKKDYYDKFAEIVKKTFPDLANKESLLIDMANIGLSLHFILAQNIKVNQLKRTISRRPRGFYSNDIERSKHIAIWQQEQKILEDKLKKLEIEVNLGMQKNKPKEFFVQNLNTEIENLQTIIGLQNEDNVLKKIVNVLFNRNKKADKKKESEEDKKKESEVRHSFKIFKKAINDSMKMRNNAKRMKKLNETFTNLDNAIVCFNQKNLNKNGIENRVKEEIQKLQNSIKNMYAIQYFFANNNLLFFTYKELIARLNNEKTTLLQYQKEFEAKKEEEVERKKEEAAKWETEKANILRRKFFPALFCGKKVFSNKQASLENTNITQNNVKINQVIIVNENNNGNLINKDLSNKDLSNKEKLKKLMQDGLISNTLVEKSIPQENKNNSSRPGFVFKIFGGVGDLLRIVF